MTLLKWFYSSFWLEMIDYFRIYPSDPPEYDTHPHFSQKWILRAFSGLKKILKKGFGALWLDRSSRRVSSKGFLSEMSQSELFTPLVSQNKNFQSRRTKKAHWSTFFKWAYQKEQALKIPQWLRIVCSVNRKRDHYCMRPFRPELCRCL